MSWPRNTDYNEAIQNLRSSVSDEELRDGQPALNPLGLPFPCSGNFADVYKVHCPKTGNTWAVKCFTREVAGLRRSLSRDQPPSKPTQTRVHGRLRVSWSQGSAWPACGSRS